METDWVQEFDGFADGPPAAGHASKSHGTSQIDQLEQELKLLHWHKLANEAALKAALIRTKKLKEQDSGRAVVETRKEKAQWMQQIIEEEQSKPLEVTEDFILKYEEQQRVEEERLEEEVQRHVKSLQRIKTNLKEKEEMRRRTMIYRTKRKALLAPLGMGNSNDAGRDEFSLPPVNGPVTPDMGRSGPGGMQGTLSKVINSLDKLVDLEKRIARLETDADGTDEHGGGSRRTQLKFKKGRQEATPTQSARNVFTVREVPRKAKKHGHQQSPQRQAGRSRRGGGGGGGSGGGSPGGSRGGRNERAERQQLRESDNMRDGEVMEDWMQKKKGQENSIAKQRRQNGGNNPRREEDMKMQNFGDVRREYDNRTERQRRKDAQNGRGSKTVPSNRGQQQQRSNGKGRLSKSGRR